MYNVHNDNEETDDSLQKEIVDSVAVSLIHLVTPRNEYVGGVFFRSDSRLVEVPSDIQPEAAEVYLDDNKITELRTGTFSHLTQCTKLDIHNNSIQTIQEDAFSGMGRLEYLYLYYNKITFLQKSMFNGLYFLKTMHIQDNLIQTIQDGCFSDLRNLNYLYLGRNKLSAISGNMWLGLSALKSLYLYNNDITALKPPICRQYLLHSLEQTYSEIPIC